MRLKIIFFCIFILVSFVSCKKNTNGSDGNDVLHPEIAAFEKRRVELTADTDHAVFNKPIHLMTKCKPIFGGKGHITLHGPSSGLSLIFEAPIQDTIKTTEVTPKRLYNVTFNKNNLFELEWKIDLITELAGYVFYATSDKALELIFP